MKRKKFPNPYPLPTEAILNIQLAMNKYFQCDITETTDEIIATFESFTMGFMITERGIYSQGLIMPLSDFNIDMNTPIGTDLTEELDVLKYEKPVPMTDDIIGPYKTQFASKTGALRLQTLTDEQYDQIRNLSMEATIKIDGTSVTVMNIDNEVHIFGREWELNPNEYKYTVAVNQGIIDLIQDRPNTVLQMELAGPRINGNRQKLSTLTYFIHSVWVDAKRIPRSEWPESFLEHAIPLATKYPMQQTLVETVNMVDGIKGNVTPTAMDEGVVYHITEPNLSVDLQNLLGSNRNIKIINNKYLTKYHE